MALRSGTAVVYGSMAVTAATIVKRELDGQYPATQSGQLPAGVGRFIGLIVVASALVFLADDLGQGGIGGGLAVLVMFAVVFKKKTVSSSGSSSFSSSAAAPPPTGAQGKQQPPSFAPPGPQGIFE